MNKKDTGSSKSNGKALVTFALTMMCGIIAGYFIFNGREAVHHDENAAQPQSSGQQKPENQQQSQSRSLQQASLKTPDTDPNQSRDVPQGSESWFIDPEIGPDLRYKNVPYIPIQWDGTCSQLPFYGIADMATLSIEAASIDPADYFASDALPVQASQFWIADGRYHQFGFKWDYNTPQTFTLEAYVSDDPHLNNASRLEVAGLNSAQSQAYSRIKEKLQSIVNEPASPSYQRGARVGRYRSISKLQEEQEPIYHFVSLRNAAVTAIEASSLTCTSSNSLNKAFCVCPDKASP